MITDGQARKAVLCIFDAKMCFQKERLVEKLGLDTMTKFFLCSSVNKLPDIATDRINQFKIVVIARKQHLLEIKGLQAGNIPSEHYFSQVASKLNLELSDEIKTQTDFLSRLLFFFVDDIDTIISAPYHQLINRAFVNTWLNPSIMQSQLFTYRQLNGFGLQIQSSSGWLKHQLPKLWSPVQSRNIGYERNWAINKYSFYNQENLKMVYDNQAFIMFGLALFVAACLYVRFTLRDESSLNQILLSAAIALIPIASIKMLSHSDLNRGLVGLTRDSRALVQRADNVLEFSKHQIDQISQDAHTLALETTQTVVLTREQINTAIGEHKDFCQRVITLTDEQLTQFRGDLKDGGSCTLKLLDSQMTDLRRSFEDKLYQVGLALEPDVQHLLVALKWAIQSATQVFSTIDNEIALTAKEVRKTLKTTNDLQKQITNSIMHVTKDVSHALGKFNDSLSLLQFDVSKELRLGGLELRSFISATEKNIAQTSQSIEFLINDTNREIINLSDNTNIHISALANDLHRNLSTMDETIDALGQQFSLFLKKLNENSQNFTGDLAKTAEKLKDAIDRGIQAGKFKPEVHAKADVSVCRIM